MAPDTAALKAIADATGGRAVDADDAASLVEAYRDIGSVVGFEDVKKPITAQYAFFALGFAVVAALGAVMMAATVAPMIPLALEFMLPQRLWALLVIPLIAVLYVVLSGRTTHRPMSSRLRLVVPKDAAWKRHGAVLLALLSLGALIIAWAVPEGLCGQAAGPRHRGGRPRRVVVHGGRGRRSQQARRRSGWGQGVRRLPAGAVQCGTCHLRRHPECRGAAHDRPRRDRPSHRRSGAGPLHRRR